MDAIKLLLSRNSAPRLREPAPDGASLNTIMQAALRVPDHAWMRPWRFLTISGEARKQLGKLFVMGENERRRNSGETELPPREAEKLANKALRAPLIVVAIANIQEHPKVPPIEQIISTGCAAHSILLAAFAQGFAGIWRTGSHAYNHSIKCHLGLSASEEIVGFLYLGTLDGYYKPLPELAVEDFCQPWPGLSEAQ